MTSADLVDAVLGIMAVDAGVIGAVLGVVLGLELVRQAVRLVKG